MNSSPPVPPGSSGASESVQDEHDALPAGTRFGELEIVRVLGVGGFGIVYLAQDHALERAVALKEYMPSSLAGRGAGHMVSIRSGAHTETYALGLRSFVNEARLLARFNHPSLVKVYRFWEQNGTAYMVMPFLAGRTLRDVRRSMSSAPTEAWIRSVIDPLLDALEQLHREGVFHRDIAPDNILLPPGELPVLLDFGAARRAIGDRTQTFTAILKPSYAPIEQYAEVVQLRQGAWTDLYALGAVVFYLLRGVPPPPATARAVQDDGPLLDPKQHPDVSPQFVAAIEWALSLRPAERPQSVAQLRDVLEARAAVPVRVHTGTTAPLVMPPVAAPVQGPVQGPTFVPTQAPTFAPTVRLEPSEEDATIVPTRPLTAPPRTTPPTRPLTIPPPRPEPPPAPRASRVPHAGVIAAFAAFVAIAAGAAWFAGERTPARQMTAVQPPPTAAPEAAGSAVTTAVVPAAPGRVAASAPALRENASVTEVKPPVVRLQRPGSRAASCAGARPAERRAASSAAARPAETRAAPPTEVAGVETPAPAVAGREPATPRQACGGRVFLALALCMEEQCELPRFKGHPQCRKVLDRLERRRRGESGD